MKIKINRYPYLIPKPIAIIGALVEGKPNFFLVADVCTTGYKIPRFVISSGKGHYTNKGIIDNASFSVSIPSVEMVAIADLCGITSGKKVDKSQYFEVFYGENLKNAPLLEETPVTHACKLVKTIDFGDTHYIFIGEIIETYIEDNLLSGKILDVNKVNPYTWYYDNIYRKIGDPIGKAYSVGKSIDKK